jgi:transposase
MRAGIVVNVTRADRRRLEAIISDRSAPPKHVWRAQIILATADGYGTAEIMRRSGKAKPVVWTWQARFMAEGVDGLLRDKTRPPGKPPLPSAIVQKVIALVTKLPPGAATHWTGRMLAQAVGVSLRSVQRILEAHQLAPHRIRTFKLSNDPKFAEKLKDVVGPAGVRHGSSTDAVRGGSPPDLSREQNPDSRAGRTRQSDQGAALRAGHL